MESIRVAAAIAAVLGSSLFFAGTSPAYKLNPLMDRYQGGTGGAFSFSDTVHEDITHAALRCAKDREGTPPSPPPPCAQTVTERRSSDPGNWGNALIRGVWWNDDPNQWLYSWHYPKWLGYMKDAESIATTGRNLRGQRRQINATYLMLYRSHYGDLQYLHAMANADGEDPRTTRDRILDWMEFAYKVATEQISDETTLDRIDLPIVRAFFINQPGWTVGRLFAPKYYLRDEPFGDLALGSMLHVVQDSFARGHAVRTFEASTACPNGRVRQFHSFVRQDSDKHAVEDFRPALLRDFQGRFTAAQNPVEGSAQLIAFARRKADWHGEVEPYLRDNLFCLGDDAIPSGPGEFAA